MKKYSFLAVLTLILFFALLQRALAEHNLNLIKARGTVNIHEIGGNGLYVFSIWDKNKGSPVGNDGNFFTVISDGRPQKISVRDDKKMTRALSIAMPADSQKIVFDAESTAGAILLRDPGFFASTNSAKDILGVIAKSRSFQDLVVFLKKKLADNSIEELMNNPEFVSHIDKCNAEVFRQDTQSITKSLYLAKDRLENLLQKE